MRVKEIDRTANMAWSPENKYPIYVAAGTAAQQLDATFSTTASIDIFALNLDECSLDMPVAASIPSDTRFHKLLWGPMKDTESGFIIGGAENGSINIYSADKMLAGDADCLSTELLKHTGAVKALDLNPFQDNLLASGGSDSEIYIWDLNKTDSPMTPGQKSQPPEELACVAWNRQVQHILGSTFSSRCVVWDLRKNEPIIKISDSMSRIKAKQIAWHPDVATQLCLSSEDDHTPVIQLWDLRYATSPLKTLESHTKGVLSVAWCLKDPDLLLSCGKDSRILCWNPNSNAPNGEVVYDLSTNNQWCFDIQWCHRNPGIISSSSFDGHITLYSLMGGGHPIQPPNKVSESFGAVPVGSAPVQVPHEQEKVLPLQKPPKWIRKPVGASFAFGGKLVCFGEEKVASGQQPSPRTVTISQVVTETDLVVRSNQLEQALNGGQFSEFCALKVANSPNPMEDSIWNFMMVNFEQEPRTKFLQLLGYDQNELAKKVVEHTGTEVAAASTRGVDAQELAQKMALLNTGSIMKAERLAASGGASPNVGSKTPDSLGSDGAAAFDNIASSQDQKSGSVTPLVIPTDDNADGLMTQALLTGNFEAAVEMCLSEDKMAEAILLAIAGGPELLIRTQSKYFAKNQSTLGRLISSVVTHDWGQIVSNCELDNWKEALAVILTYALPEEFSELCDVLAQRLESERSGRMSLYASLCYICSGNVDKLVDNWVKNTKNSREPLALQDLVEKVMLLRKAVEMSRGSAPEVTGGSLAEKLSEYAGMLAAQGNMATALAYLNNSTDMGLAILQDRLCRAIGPQAAQQVASPYQALNVLPEGAQQQQQKGQQATAGRQTNTTTTTNFYSQSQTNFAPSAPAPNIQTSSFTPQPVTTPAPAPHKGLGRYPKQPSAAPSYDSYGQNPGYGAPSQPMYNPQPQPAPYNPQPNYGGYDAPASNPGGYGNSVYNPVSSTPAPGPAPNMFNPGAQAPSPYNPPPVQQPPTSSQGGRSYQDMHPDSGWNDPPSVADKRNRTGSMSADTAPPGAPTYPGLYNPAEHQPTPQHIPNYSSPGGYQGPGGYTPTPTPMNPGQPPQQTFTQKAPVAPAQPPQPVPKGPLPAEHLTLQTVLDQLVKSCLQMAPNAQMKRKLEDVTRKLEVLYDKLRTNVLSPAVTAGLHQITASVQQYDYPSGLQVYTGMVSQSNFTEISSFMPALKVLLQAAQQMQVYVQ